MRDVTDAVRKFRTASRDLWNNYLLPGPGVLNFDVEASFHVIERELLRSLVFSHDAARANGYRTSGDHSIVVRLIEGVGKVEALVGVPDICGNVAWDSSIDVDPEDQPVLYFFDFFDWFHYGLIEYELVRVVERDSGKLMLLPQAGCSFFIPDATSG